MDERPASSRNASAWRTFLATVLATPLALYRLAPELVELLSVPADKQAGYIEVSGPLIAAALVASAAWLGSTARTIAHERGGIWAKLFGNTLP